MKKVTYGMGLLASAMFAVAIAHAQSGGGSGSSSASAGAAGSGTAGGTTGTGPAGSSGVGASSPSNLNTGGAGATGTGAGAAGTRATGAGVGTGAAGAPGFSRQGTGAGGAAGTPSGVGTTTGRASAGAAGAQNAQPGGTSLGTGAAGSQFRTGAPGTGLSTGAAGTTGTTGSASGLGTTGAAGLRSGTTFDTQRNLGVQGDFNQRTTVEQQRLIDQQRAGLRTQQGDFNRTRSQFSDESQLRTDATMDRDAMDADAAMQSSQRTLANGSPGELGVFVNDAGERGVLISRIVDGSAAALAGLEPGDIIIGVDEQMIAAPGDLTRIIRSIPAGEVAQLQVIRDGAEYDVDATLMPMRDRAVVGYRGATSTSGDLAARVSRLEEQLAMVLDELQSVRREVVVLRGGSSETRYSERAGRTSVDGEFGARSATETGTEFQQRETERGIGVGTEFDQRSSTEAGIGTDVNESGTDTGFDARSRTEAGASGTGSRVPPPPIDQSDRNRAGEGASQSPGADDDLFGTSGTDASQSDANRPATENEQDQQSATDTDSSLPF